MAESVEPITVKSNGSNLAMPKRRIPYWPFVLIILGVAGYFGVKYYLYSRHFETTDDAFIDGTIVQVSPRVAGQVLKVYIHDNQRVKEGDPLVEIDPKPFETNLAVRQAAAVVAQAKQGTAEKSRRVTGITTGANVEEAQAAVKAARKTADEARAAVAAAEAEAKRTAVDLKRYEKLEQTAISRQLKDQADAAARVAKARLEQAKEQVAAATAQVAVAEGRLQSAQSAPQQVAVSESQITTAEAEVKQAGASVNSAELDLSYTKIFAPAAGKVTRKSVDPGEFVQVGQALMALVTDNIYVTANFKETQLDDMRVGQPVEIEVDAYPKLKLKAHVDSIQAGSGSRFSLLPPENATGNYVKVVQRVPVKIVFDEKFDEKFGEQYDLGPGMSVVPSVRVR